MTANAALQETDLIDAAVAWLSEHLPESWSVERREQPAPGATGGQQRGDATIQIRDGRGTFTTFAIEAKRSFLPRDVDRLLAGLTRQLRALAPNIQLLVVAPWLSTRTQELLEREGLNYLDLTGNACIRVDYPAVYLRTAGSSRNPKPEPRRPATLRGKKAARLVRLLADVRPPYGVRELAAAAELTPGYVSRLLDALDRDALVDRSRRGEVVAVDLGALLRQWAQSYDVVKSNDAQRFVAPAGAGEALERLGAGALGTSTCVTGSFAAVRWAPVASPALLMVYTRDLVATAPTLDLLPADDGANVVLLQPFDPVVWYRTSRNGGITYAAPSQVAVDCLTGTGRMPAEGEALLKWMAESQPEWRFESLAELGRPR